MVSSEANSNASGNPGPSAKGSLNTRYFARSVNGTPRDTASPSISIKNVKSNSNSRVTRPTTNSGKVSLIRER